MEAGFLAGGGDEEDTAVGFYGDFLNVCDSGHFFLCDSTHVWQSIALLYILW